MVIILIRRLVRADREQEFLQSYRAQEPNQNPAFFGETLTRVDDSPEIPADMRNLPLTSFNSITYFNIARWASWTAFRDHFAGAGIGFDARIETAAAQQVVLDVVQNSAKGPE